jgi:hypothetical protein
MLDSGSTGGRSLGVRTNLSDSDAAAEGVQLTVVLTSTPAATCFHREGSSRCPPAPAFRNSRTPPRVRDAAGTRASKAMES